jgi:hypothetical protein
VRSGAGADKVTAHTFMKIGWTEWASREGRWKLVCVPFLCTPVGQRFNVSVELVRDLEVAMEIACGAWGRGGSGTKGVDISGLCWIMLLSCLVTHPDVPRPDAGR